MTKHRLRPRLNDSKPSLLEGFKRDSSRRLGGEDCPCRGHSCLPVACVIQSIFPEITTYESFVIIHIALRALFCRFCFVPISANEFALGSRRRYSGTDCSQNRFVFLSFRVGTSKGRRDRLFS